MDTLEKPVLFSVRVCVTISLTVVVLSSFVARTTSAQQTSKKGSGYLLAVRQELARLNLEADCQQSSATCVFAQKIGEGEKGHKVFVSYSSENDIVYIYVERFLVLDNCDGPSLELCRKLLELNRKMVTAKLEWNKVDCTIRLSNTINTDSNFDRRAFRSQVQGLLATAKSILPSLLKKTASVDK